MEVPAQSREDKDVEICPACGTAEALEAFAFAIGKIGFDSPPPKFRGWANPPYQTRRAARHDRHAQGRDNCLVRLGCSSRPAGRAL